MNPTKGNALLLLLSLLLVCPICTSLDTITPTNPSRMVNVYSQTKKPLHLGFSTPAVPVTATLEFGSTKSLKKPLCGLQTETLLSMIPLESSPSTVRETLYSTPKTKPLLFGPPMFLFLCHPQIILWPSY